MPEFDISSAFDKEVKTSDTGIDLSSAFDKKSGFDISASFDKGTKKENLFMPTLRKPKIFELLPQATTEIGTGISGLFKPPESKPIDVTEPYYPEPSTTFRPSTDGFKGTPQIKRGLSIAEEGIPVQQLKEGREPSATPIEDFMQQLGERVGQMTEGKKGLEWLASKGSQFVYSIPLSIYQMGDMLGKVVSGDKTPKEGYEMLFQTLPEPVNNFLDMAGGALSPLASKEQQEEGLKEAWSKFRVSPEAPAFSVAMGLGLIKGSINLVGQTKGYWKTIPKETEQLVEKVIKESEPNIPEKPIIPPEIQNEPSIGKLAIEQSELLKKAMEESDVSPAIEKAGVGEPILVQRIGDKIQPTNIDFALDKPQGLYVSPAEGKSAWEDLGGEKRTYEISPKNVLDVSKVTKEDIIWIPSRRATGAKSAGIKAFEHFFGENELKKILDTPKKEAVNILKNKYPDVDWSKYYDTYEMAEALAGIEARRLGFDVIYSPDIRNPEFSEYTILDKNIIKEVSEKPVAPTSMTTEVAGGGAISPIKGTGETKVRGLAKHIEEKAIESGLTKGFGDLPEYQTVNMKEQAGKASELITNNYEQAKKIAMGTESSPKDILPEALLVGVENQAIKSGDVATIRDLALNSNLISEATTMGQRIRTLAERDPESLIGHIRDIAKKREEAFIRRTQPKGMGEFFSKDVNKVRQKVVEGIKTEISKISPTRQTWESFIQSIRC